MDTWGNPCFAFAGPRWSVCFSSDGSSICASLRRFSAAACYCVHPSRRDRGSVVCDSEFVWNRHHHLGSNPLIRIQNNACASWRAAWRKPAVLLAQGTAGLRQRLVIGNRDLWCYLWVSPRPRKYSKPRRALTGPGTRTHLAVCCGQTGRKRCRDQ
jgi:hypothetical protein